MNILELVNQATLRVGHHTFTSLFIEEPASSLWLALAVAEGRELLNRREWSKLSGRATYTSDASGKLSLQSLTPASMEGAHRFLSGSFFDANRNRYEGVTNISEWEEITQSPNMCYAYFEDYEGVYVNPIPPLGTVFSRRFITKNWIEKRDGTPRDMFIEDEDKIRLPEELFILGIQVRYLYQKGLEHSAIKRAYEIELQSQTLDAPTISMFGNSNAPRIRAANGLMLS
jgi:hypothetical protein